MKINIKIRFILWFILAGITGWILYMGVVPSGKIAYKNDFSGDNYFISNLTPKERVDNQSSNFSREIGTLVVGNPVYFSLRTPRSFDSAKLILKYKINETELFAENSASFSVIEAGVLADKTIWRYDLKPIMNRMIDGLSLVWDAMREKSIILLQKEKKFDSIEEFNNSTTSIEKIAVYNYDLGREYILPGYESSESTKSDSVDFYALRGNWQLYTYIKDEELDFMFTFSDLNNNKDPDPLDLRIYYEDALIDSRHLDDDGIIDDTGEKRMKRGLSLKLDNLPEGAYKIELRANDDIITERIKTAQSRVSFINKIRLAKAGNTFITVWTDSRVVQAKTVHPDSLQTLGVGTAGLELKETYKQYKINIDRPVPATNTSIFIDRDGVEINGDGVFSFSKSAHINPRIKKVDNNLDIIGERVEYIIAEYEEPRRSGEWHLATAEFDLRRAYRENGKYSFIISIQGLDPDDGIDDALIIQEIKVELEGKSLDEKIKTVISNM